MREFYSDPKDVKHDNPTLTKALKLGKRCLNQVEADEDAVTAPPSKSKYRQTGGGRKLTIADIRQVLFEWFVDIRGTLKARLIMQADREERIFEYLKNIQTARKYFIENFGVDLPVLNGDQMPLHRNESSTKKTLNFTGLDTYVKENYSLSRERIIVYTQVCKDPKVSLKPEFVFKGKGVQVKLNPPQDMKFQWAPKGSYRLEHMLSTIANLPNRPNIFTHQN